MDYQLFVLSFQTLSTPFSNIKDIDSEEKPQKTLNDKQQVII